MPTTLSKPYRHPAEPPDLPEVEYPDEVIEELNRISEFARVTGELMTLEEFAAERGLKIG